ncbi:MAG: adenylate/guanylate cyclase domain-containing protein [Chthoniobacteraceae bacterium]
MTFLTRHRRVLLAAVCVLCTGLVALTVWTGYEPMVLLDFSTRDYLTRQGKKSPTHPDIVFLAIDQPSISLDGAFTEEIEGSPALKIMRRDGWPWSREVHGMVIDRLLDAGAKVVALDILFPTEREGDDALRAVLERRRDKVVIGANIVDMSDPRLPKPTRSLTPPSPSLISPGDSVDPRVGFVNFWPDSELDNVVRHARYRISFAELNDLPPSQESEIIPSLIGRILLKLGRGDLIPSGYPCFRFTSPIQPLPLWEIFVPRLWDSRYGGGEFFRGKIVLIGPEGNWSKDFIRTPFNDIPGPALHLHALNAALNQDFIHEPSRMSEMAGILIAGLVAWALSTFVTQPFTRFLLFLAGSVAFFFAALLLFGLGSGATLLSVAPPLLAANSSGLVWLIIEQVLDRMEKARTRRTLERYVSKDLVKDILDNPASILNTLGGVRKSVAILFSDLRDFTTMMEAADSQQFVAQLNEYLTHMVKCIFDSKGTLDKFIGDAIMAVWGEVYTEGPAKDIERAVTAAMQMDVELTKLNKQWEKRGLPPFKMGIGINYGPVIVGNIGATGATEKMELTVIGDPVNLASRLEGLTKEYGLELVLGESAADLVVEAFHLQFVDLVQVKGKTRPISVFTVLGPRREPLAQNVNDYLAGYEEGLKRYRMAKFASAIESFHRCLKSRPGDPLATMYLERCTRLQDSPPGPDWNGVFVMTKK